MSTPQDALPGTDELRKAIEERIPAPQRERVFLSLLTYARLLLQWNRRSNLISRADEPRLLARHLLDALALLPVIERLGPTGLLDIGSGGGLPGIPVAVARPDLPVTLLESRRQKALFLLSAARTLELTNTRVWCTRAEALGKLPAPRRRSPDSAEPQPVPPAGTLPSHLEPPAERPAFDLVVARAVADVATLAHWTAPLVRPGGRIVLYKGSRLDEEQTAWARDPGGWEMEEVLRDIRPQTHLLVLRRTGSESH